MTNGQSLLIRKKSRQWRLVQRLSFMRFLRVYKQDILENLAISRLPDQFK